VLMAGGVVPALGLDVRREPDAAATVGDAVL
jgi:hypothetical protein